MHRNSLPEPRSQASSAVDELVVHDNNHHSIEFDAISARAAHLASLVQLSLHAYSNEGALKTSSAALINL